MKVTIDGVEIEGTAAEVAEIVKAHTPGLTVLGKCSPGMHDFEKHEAGQACRKCEAPWSADHDAGHVVERAAATP